MSAGSKLGGYRKFSEEVIMSGKAPRQKGERFERSIVKALGEAGISARRVPLSGSAKG